jgi:Fe-S cluster assembly protein SufD
MTIAVTRTKAEQAYSETFEAVAAKLPGGRAVSDARRAAIGAFAGLGLPHRRIEEWKYTDLRSALKEMPRPAIADRTLVTAAQLDAALEALAGLDAHRVVFVNGAYRPELSTAGATEGLEVVPFTHALQSLAEALTTAEAPGQEATVALNTAFATDGARVLIGRGARPGKPVLLAFVRAGSEPRLVTTRNSLEIGAGARATIIEAHVALPNTVGGQANTLSQVSVDKGAAVTHVKCTLEGAGTSHIAGWLASLGAGCRYRAFHLTAGTGLVRNNIAVTFKGEGAKLDVSGAFLCGGTEHVDTTLVIDHAVPACESRELFKGVLADRGRGVFQGKVIVRPDAQKTDGKQMAQALMLSEEAEFDSKPELEIFADDVICGHGSTAAEIDENLLFYMRSRGIPLDDARRLLLESFVGEALDKVEDEGVREALAAIAARRLSALTD